MKTHLYRISEAAAGKTFIEILNLVRSSELQEDQLHDMMFAALNYIEVEKEPVTGAKLNPFIWQRMKDKIDKSARRSAAARARAAKRKEKKHSLISGSYKPASELIAEDTNPSRRAGHSSESVGHPMTDTGFSPDNRSGNCAGTSSAASPMDTQHLKEILPLLSPENQKELLRIEQEKFEYAKEQEKLRKEEAAEQERKRIEDEKAAEKKRKEDLERKRREMDAFVSWQLAGRPPTNHRFDIF